MARVVCQPYIFGKGDVDWNGVEELKDKLNNLLKEKKGNINITRIARLYDGILASTCSSQTGCVTGCARWRCGMRMKRWRI